MALIIMVIRCLQNILIFSSYLERQYPDYKKNFQGILESTQMPDGYEQYNMDEVVGAIISILNSCAGDEWNLFETCLSDDSIRMIISENSWWFKILDIESSNDNDVLHDMYDNEDIATNLSEGYLILKK